MRKKPHYVKIQGMWRIYVQAGNSHHFEFSIKKLGRMKPHLYESGYPAESYSIAYLKERYDMENPPEPLLKVVK